MLATHYVECLWVHHSEAHGDNSGETGEWAECLDVSHGLLRIFVYFCTQ